MKSFAREWRRRIKAPGPRVPAGRLYLGQTRELIDELEGRADMAIASAGLGLLTLEAPAPGYEMSIITKFMERPPPGPDGVRPGWHDKPDALPNLVPDYHGPTWWGMIRKLPLREFAEGRPLLVALNQWYLEMLADDLLAVDRLFIIGPKMEPSWPEKIRAARLPYDWALVQRAGIANMRMRMVPGAIRHFFREIDPRWSRDKIEQAILKARRPPGLLY